MTVTVHDLDLPHVDVLTLDRDSALAAYTAARTRHWLARTPIGFAVTAHTDVTAILRDRRFHSAISLLPSLAGVDGPIRERQGRSILAMEGDEHTRVRRLAAPAFTPQASDRLRSFMRNVVNELVDPLIDRGSCEFVSEVSEPYPVPIICELLGAPREDWKLFSGWATDIFKIFNNDVADDLPRIQSAMADLDDYVVNMIQRRRTEPADDLLSRMIAIEAEGDRMSNSELVMMTEAVLMAGTDTTRNQLACAVALFTGHPDQWRLLAEQPELAAPAVEEVMRHLGTVRSTLRVAAEDVEYRGVIFPAGTLILTSLAAANHDDEHWAAPNHFDITRPPSGAAHMTFGAGIHYCLGASLARAELQEALPILAARLPGLRADGPIRWKPPTAGIWGPESLPIAF